MVQYLLKHEGGLVTRTWSSLLICTYPLLSLVFKVSLQVKNRRNPDGSQAHAVLQTTHHSGVGLGFLRFLEDGYACCMCLKNYSFWEATFYIARTQSNGANNGVTRQSNPCEPNQYPLNSTTVPGLYTSDTSPLKESQEPQGKEIRGFPAL